jgi:hypothetical protein
MDRQLAAILVVIGAVIAAVLALMAYVLTHSGGS